MAINQVSLFFYAPRWAQQVTLSSWARTDEDKPVQIANAVPTGDEEAPTIPGSKVKEWLAKEDFISVEWGRGRVFERGQVHSFFGPEKEIEVHVNEEGEEVTDLYCRFTLTWNNPPPLAAWASFVATLCERFGLRLGAERLVPCTAKKFVDAVKANHNYQRFASTFGWE